jgi:hypothetical protein
MKSLLMTDAYNNAEQLKASLEADLEIMECFEKLMELEEKVQKKALAKEKKTEVKHLHYRKTA